MKKAVYAVSVLFLLSIPVGAQQPGQSHNLSEIHPIDINFNMSDRSIYNLSQIRLNDGTLFGTGLVFDDYSIRDEGNNYRFTLDTSNEVWNIFGADLNLGGNSIIRPDRFMTGGQNITVRDSSNSLDIARFSEGGNVGIPNGNLDMKGNNVTSSDGEICAGNQC